jgi:hypothetical protein
MDFYKNKTVRLVFFSIMFMFALTLIPSRTRVEQLTGPPVNTLGKPIKPLDKPVSAPLTIEQTTQLTLSSNCACRKHEQIILIKKPNGGPFTVLLSDSRKGNIRTLYSMNEQAFQKATFTCDLYKTLRRGPHQQVIGFSLYGTDENFYKHLPGIVGQVRDIYKNKWHMRIYYDKTINMSAICELECLKDDAGAYYDLVDFCDANKIYESYEGYKSGKPFNADYVHAMMW